MNNTINKIDLFKIYGILYPQEQNTFFLSAHKIFTKLDLILGHKTKFNKFKRIEII